MRGISAPATPQALSPHVTFVPGTINSVLFQQEAKALAVYGAPQSMAANVERVLFTHARRDAVWFGRALVEQDVFAVAPKGEQNSFTAVEEFWNRFAGTARYHDYAQQSTKILRHPLTISRYVSQGERIQWRGQTIEVIETPGFTRGAVSYLWNVDGLTFACTGDLIWAGGRILDLYSLQDHIAETEPPTRGYHGYAARCAPLIASLQKIAEHDPDYIFPARGPVITNPKEAIQSLIQKIRAVYKNYLSISALRWYWGDDYIRALAQRVLGTSDVEWMGMAETRQEEPPPWILPIQNSRLLISSNGGGFLIDCGSKEILNRVKELQNNGVIKRLDGLYITHYHDDHTHWAQESAETFQCPVYAAQELKDILEHPAAYRLPAMTDRPIERVQGMPHQSVLQWEEFTFTLTYHPGQTLYHGGLLVEKADGEAVFFCGDSFTPSGIDDYCLLNRNFLHENSGYFRTLRSIKTLPPNCLLINQHVKEPFRFSDRQMDYMINQLQKRVDVMEELFPWDNVNFGVDERWMRFYPYGTAAHAGERVQTRVVIKNHSSQRQQFKVRLHPPAGWILCQPVSTIELDPRQEGSMVFSVQIPSEADSNTYVITGDVSYGDYEFNHWTETLVTVTPKS